MSTSAVARPTERAPIDLRMVESMLQFVAGNEDRETWLAVGMALKSEFGDEGFDAWDRWSQDARNYDRRACSASWRGFRSRQGAGYTIGTLIKLARDGGYQFEPGQRPDPAELARRRQERAERAQREQAQRQAQAQRAEDMALAAWRAGLREGTSDYLVRKGLEGAESIRYTEQGDILVPMLRYDLPREQSLKGLQVIRADGSKRFTPGMAKAGTACRLGLSVVDQPVIVCEGYATGMSIRMALERRVPVFVAFDAYNLPTVCDAIYKSLPTCPILICADDDWKTRIGGMPTNIGAIQAQLAMESVMEAGGRLVCRTSPVFRKATPPGAAARGDGDTDFNDLHRLEGLAEVASQLQVALDALNEVARYG